MKANNMQTKEIAAQFYAAFAQGDVDTMLRQYHSEVVFEDPAFGILKGARAHAMWRMLLTRSQGNLKIEFDIKEAADNYAKVLWIASYPYGPQKRPVVNKVNAILTINEDKIIKHTDVFNFWKWSIQALGFPGYLLGWTSFLNSRVQKTTNTLLDDFMSKNRAI